MKKESQPLPKDKNGIFIKKPPPPPRPPAKKVGYDCIICCIKKMKEGL